MLSLRIITKSNNFKMKSGNSLYRFQAFETLFNYKWHSCISIFRCHMKVMTSNNFANSFHIFFFSVILERTIRIPRSLSVKANSILKGFLNKNPADRLGCNRESGFAEIMTHQFFRNYIDWELVSPFLYLVLLVTELPTLPIWLPFYKV